MKRLLLLMLFLPLAVFGQSKDIYHPFTGTLVLSVGGGPTLGMTDYTDFNLDYMGMASLEYFFPTYSKSSLGIKAFGAYGYLKATDAALTPNEVRTDLLYYGGALVYNLSIGEVFFPQFSAGASILSFKPKTEGGVVLTRTPAYETTELNFNADFGFRILLTKNLTFNLIGGVFISPEDNLDNLLKGTDKDNILFGQAGLSFAFFGDTDEDGDGIPDSEDMCLGTPPGVKTDPFGCPYDEDKDGVYDYLDDCPGTPEGVKVDRAGCPADTDKDGVPDYLDICTNTPRNVRVDQYGCPVDTDEDGVPDYLDQCPSTLPGVTVDKNGCPLDTDGDGVFDVFDKCPNTPSGVQVDSTGCPIKKEQVIKEVQVPVPYEVTKEFVLSAGASFRSGSSELLPAAYADLDRLAAEMIADVKSTWLIEGHTDNVGKPEVNKRISLQRANAVLKYLTGKGIDAKRFTVRGMGHEFPVADNSTEEGRAQNRRVVIVRLN